MPRYVKFSHISYTEPLKSPDRLLTVSLPNPLSIARPEPVLVSPAYISNHGSLRIIA